MLQSGVSASETTGLHKVVTLSRLILEEGNFSSSLLPLKVRAPVILEASILRGGSANRSPCILTTSMLCAFGSTNKPCPSPWNGTVLGQTHIKIPDGALPRTTTAVHEASSTDT